jgi:ketosteroid isomerase-like protein
MSEENVEIVRRMYEAVNSVDRTGGFVDPEHVAPDLWNRLAPEFELHQRYDLPGAKSYLGRERSKEFWREIQEVFAEVRWQPLDVLDGGDTVVVDARVAAKGRGSEIEVEVDETDVFWFREGVLVRLQAFPNRTEALEAAGLSE